MTEIVEDPLAQPVVGLDIGKRRVAIGWPYWAFSTFYDLDKYGWTRQHELLGLREFVVGRVPPGAKIWAELPYLSGGAASNATVTADLAATLGAIVSGQRWADFQTVLPNTWKAAVLGNSTATKEEIQDWLKANHPQLYAATMGEENAVDAMCIGLYGIMREIGQVQPPVKAPRKKAPRGPRAP